MMSHTGDIMPFTSQLWPGIVYDLFYECIIFFIPPVCRKLHKLRSSLYIIKHIILTLRMRTPLLMSVHLVHQLPEMSMYYQWRTFFLDIG